MGCLPSVRRGAAGAGARDGSTPADWARRFGHAAVAEFLDTHVAATASLAEDASVSEALAAYQAGVDADDVDLALIEGLLAYACGEGRFKDTEVDIFATKRGLDVRHMLLEDPIGDPAQAFKTYLRGGVIEAGL
jgi:hypothetical protein